MDQSLVMAYELGNEPNLYGSHREPNYNVHNYAEDMQDWLPRLRSRSQDDMKFQFPSFAGPELFKPDMTIANLVNLGVPQSIPDIEYFSIHGYPWNICNGLSNSTRLVASAMWLTRLLQRKVLLKWTSETSSIMNRPLLS